MGGGGAPALVLAICGCLRLSVGLPADSRYEVVIEFGIAIGLIMAGVWISLGFQRERFRFSLETALLAMVVVAISSAVIGKAPELGWADWLSLFSIGGAIAIVSLLSLWLVFGQARLSHRLPLGLLGFLVFTALYYSSSATHYLLIQPEWSFAWLERLWERATDPKMLSWGLGHCILTSLLGFTTLCTVLALARGSRWFTVADDNLLQPSNKRTLAARLGLVAMMLCLFSPLCYLFFRLMTPTPYPPVVEMPVDNGWDDLVAAGNLREDENDYSVVWRTASIGTSAEASAAIARVLPTLDRIDLGMSRSNFTADPLQAEKDGWPICRACYCLQAKCFYAERFGKPQDQLTAIKKLLHFGALVNKNPGIDWKTENHVVVNAHWTLKKFMANFDANQCQQIVELQYKYDSKRGSLENRLYYQRLADENHGWLRHVQLLTQEWSGEDPYAWDSQQYLSNIRHTRMLIVQFALQRYFLDNQRLPENLAELVPDYLPAILIDPHTNKPFHYQHLWGGYALSTLDENAEDRALVTGPAAPYLWQRLQESWQGFRATVLRMRN